jgi:HSP20 family protein
MPAIVTRTDSTRAARDPFALARELLTWDPFRVEPDAGFAPRFEVRERADSYVLVADLPGVKLDDLDISLQTGVLTVAGAREPLPRVDGESFYVRERRFGAFSRSFALPELADPDRVEARLTDGVLTITVGKRSEARPRKIGVTR